MGRKGGYAYGSGGIGRYLVVETLGGWRELVRGDINGGEVMPSLGRERELQPHPLKDSMILLEACRLLHENLRVASRQPAAPFAVLVEMVNRNARHAETQAGIFGA